MFLFISLPVSVKYADKQITIAHTKKDKDDVRSLSRKKIFRLFPINKTVHFKLTNMSLNATSLKWCGGMSNILWITFDSAIMQAINIIIAWGISFLSHTHINAQVINSGMKYDAINHGSETPESNAVADMKTVKAIFLYLMFNNESRRHKKPNAFVELCENGWDMNPNVYENAGMRDSSISEKTAGMYPKDFLTVSIAVMAIQIENKDVDSRRAISPSSPSNENTKKFTGYTVKYQLSTVGFQSWMAVIPLSNMCLHTMGLLTTSGSTGKYLVVIQTKNKDDIIERINKEEFL